MLYPILGIGRESGDAALLLHALTPAEQAMFLAMDSACVQLPEDSELEAFHHRVAQIGAMHGLGFAASVALWTRLTFSLFEPDSSVAAGADSSDT